MAGQVVHDRLAALEMMLLQKPIVSGRYSGCVHKRFMLPLRPYYVTTLRLCAHVMTASVASWADVFASAKPRVVASIWLQALYFCKTDLRVSGSGTRPGSQHVKMGLQTARTPSASVAGSC